MKKSISFSKAEDLVAFAQNHKALIEQKEFKSFDRHIILTTEGTVSVKSPKDGEDSCTIETFKGFNESLDTIKKTYSPIALINFDYF